MLVTVWAVTDYSSYLQVSGEMSVASVQSWLVLPTERGERREEREWSDVIFDPLARPPLSHHILYRSVLGSHGQHSDISAGKTKAETAVWWWWWGQVRNSESGHGKSPGWEDWLHYSSEDQGLSLQHLQPLQATSPLLQAGRDGLRGQVQGAGHGLPALRQHGGGQLQSPRDLLQVLCQPGQWQQAEQELLQQEVQVRLTQLSASIFRIFLSSCIMSQK